MIQMKNKSHVDTHSAISVNMNRQYFSIHVQNNSIFLRSANDMYFQYNFHTLIQCVYSEL